MSTFKKMVRDRVQALNLPSNAENATENCAGGVSFEIEDAALKLVTMTGGSFFAEPKYYNSTQCYPVQNSNGSLNTLISRIEIVDGKLGALSNCDELNHVARDVLATAIDVANSSHPSDLLAIASWLRGDMNIRLTPQVLLVIASRMDNTKSLVRKYIPSIVKRPDEVKTCLLIYRFFFGMKSLPNGLSRGLSDVVSQFGEAGLLKYNQNVFPRWKDVLCWLPRKKGFPLSYELGEYFRSGKILDPIKTPIISARSKLSKKTEFDNEAKTLALQSKVNWEVLLSQFGGFKNEVWSFLIKNNLVGYMALIRNLRNLLEAKVNRNILNKVCDKLIDKVEVINSKQLPFRFFSAYKSIVKIDKVDEFDRGKLVAAIKTACNYSCENTSVLPGTTVIFADISGSMGVPLSVKSDVTCKDAATMLCGIVAKICEVSYVCAFGGEVAPIQFSQIDSVIDIADKTAVGDVKTHNTNGYKCVNWLMENKLVPDRVIFLSDMQMWNDSHFSDNSTSLSDVWGKYIKYAPGANKTWIHTVHIGGYGDNVVQGNRVNLVGGFSEKVFTMILQTEGMGAMSQALPTMEQIRMNWEL